MKQYLYKIESLIFLKMVSKKTGIIAIGFLVFLFFVISVGVFSSYGNENSDGLSTGNSIKETLSQFYETSTIGQRIFLSFQFFLLFLIVVAIVVIIKNVTHTKDLFQYNNFMEKGRSKTDLDSLYKILKEKKSMSISDISRVFKVDLEVALGWAKILESGDLAIIEYPRFGKPILTIMGKAQEKSKEKNDEIKKDTLKYNLEGKKENNVQKNIDEKVIDFKDTLKCQHKEIRKIEKETEKKIRKIDKKTEKIEKKIEKKKNVLDKHFKKLNEKIDLK